MDDRAFADIGLSHHDVAKLRERLAAWPRDAHAADQQPQPGNPVDPRPEHQPRHERAAQAEHDDPEAEP